MVSAQLERLQQDSENLATFISQLQTSGEDELVKRFKLKKTYLDNRIAEIRTG